MPRRTQPRPAPDLPLHRFAVTLRGVSPRAIKQDLARLNLLRRSNVRNRWRVRKATAKALFEERVWGRTGKLDIFPTEAGKVLLRELYEAGELTLKAGFSAPAVASTPTD